MKAFIERCREVNTFLNAIVEERFTGAMEDAKKVDQFLGNTDKSMEQIREETPLLGVPITVKEACECAGKCGEKITYLREIIFDPL